MNGPILRRTFLDQARLRTWVFIILLAFIAVIFTIFPLYEMDQNLANANPSDEYYADVMAERDQFDSSAAWALILGFPVFNAKLLLLFFGVLAGVSATASEWQDRTVFLLFSKPVSRVKIVVSKMVGAYGWVAIAVILAGLTVVISGAIMGMKNVVSLQFFATVLWTALAMFPIVAMGGFAGIMIRRGIPAITLAVAMIAILAPLVGAAGYVVAMQDDDFKTVGQYTDDDFTNVRKCGQMHDVAEVYDAQNRQQLDENYAGQKQQFETIHACRAGWVGETDQFYIDQNVEPMQFPYQSEWCQVQAYYEGAGDELPYYAADDFNCYSDSFYDVRSAALLSKFKKTSIDFPRYLSPANLLHSWEPVTGWDVQDATGSTGEVLRFSMWEIVYPANGAGARPTPLSGWASGLALMMHIVLWPALGVFGVTRRDLH